MKKPPLLVSACLVGKRCRYNGQEKSCPSVTKLAEQYELIPFCPEVAGGLATPRPPAEIQGGNGSDVLAGRAKVINRDGVDVTAEYVAGARAGAELVRRLGVRKAVLKERSPACGSTSIYDGSFGGVVRAGHGVLAAALKEAGVKVLSEEDVERLN